MYHTVGQWSLTTRESRAGGRITSLLPDSPAHGFDMPQLVRALSKMCVERGTDSMG